MNASRTLAIARKETIQIVRDWRSLLIVATMPVVLMGLMGYGISLDQKHVPICVMDRDGTQRSQDLLKRFQASPYFDLVAVIDTYPAMVRALDADRCRMGIVVPQNFAQDLNAGQAVGVQGLIDATDDNTANLVIGYAQAVISNYSNQVQLDYLERRGLPDTFHPLQVEARVWFNEALESRNFIVPGVVAIVMAVIGTFLASLTVAREWERGTMEQLISTPVRPMEVTVGKLLPYFVIGMADAAMCVLISILWFGVPLRGSVSMLTFASALFLTVVLLLGYLISAGTKSQLVASQFALLATFLPSFLLSGFAFPIEQMPAVVRAITYVVPARYYVSLLKNIFLKGVGMAADWRQILALVVFATVVAGLATRALRKTL